jgi:hypothetical protein
MYKSLSYIICIARVFDDHRSCQKLINYITNKKAISCFLFFFSLTIKDKTNISLTIKILHLGQSSFTGKVRTIFDKVIDLCPNLDTWTHHQHLPGYLPMNMNKFTKNR